MLRSLAGSRKLETNEMHIIYYLNMMRGFTYPLYATPDQEVKFSQFSGVCRLLWNLALEQRRSYWRQYQQYTGNNLNYVTQARELTALRAEFDFVRDVHVTPLQRTLKSLDNAFQRAWKGTANYPKPKKKGVNDTFSFAGREVRIEKVNGRWGRVRLPKIGWVKFRFNRPIEGSVCEAFISRTPVGWSISFGCTIDRDVPDAGGFVGIDRGVTVPLMLSDGTEYYLPKTLLQTESKAQKAQKVASRRKRGSKRFVKAQKRVASLRAKAARIRKHWAHECTTDISRRNGTVVIERLRTQKMTARARNTGVAQKRGLNRAILNVGWRQIEEMLSYKSFNLIKVNPAHTSQSCSSCGAVDSKSRKSQAVFSCTSCGYRVNADKNAAINILHRGNTPGVEPILWGGDEARTVQAA